MQTRPSMLPMAGMWLKERSRDLQKEGERERRREREREREGRRGQLNVIHGRVYLYTHTNDFHLLTSGVSVSSLSYRSKSFRVQRSVIGPTSLIKFCLSVSTST